MIRSNLTDILRKFSAKEMKEFGEYVRSPFFNKNESNIKLYDYLRKFYPDFEDKRLDKEYTYKKIFSGTKYNDGFMRTTMFNLSCLAEDYLAFTNFKRTGVTEKNCLIYELNQRDLGKIFEKTVKEVSDKLEKKEQKNARYYYYQYSLEEENLSYLTRIKFEKNEKFIRNTGIQNIFNNLTYFYLIRILQYYVYVLNSKSIYQVEFKTELIEDILSKFNPELYEDVPLIRTYFNMVMLHLKEDEEHYYFELKKMAQDMRDKIGYEDYGETFINLENYCKRKLRKGNKKFLRELFEIYKMELDKDFYVDHNRMPQKLYRGAVDAGLRLDEFEWVKHFIEKYKNKMYPEFRENNYQYCLALYNFAKGNFEESLRISSKVKYNDIYQKLELKCLTGALYYELEMDEQLLASLDSFRHIISNDLLIPEDRKQYYLKFIKYTKKLLKLKNSYSPEEFDTTRHQLENDSPSFNDEWLKGKLLALQRKNTRT
jgi:hypothetical protein